MYKYNFPSTNSTHIRQNMIAEAQIAINELQIDDIQDAKYEIAKNINKIATKTYSKLNQRRTPKTKNSTECKKKIKK